MGRLHWNVLLPTLTSLLGFGFAVVLIRRFGRRRQAYHFVWALGLTWYALAAGSEAVGGAFGWTPILYRIWYLTGAIGVAAYLGAGTVYLHRESAFGSLVVVCLLVGSIPALAGRHVGVGLLGLSTATLLTIVLTWRPTLFAHVLFGLLGVFTLAAALQIFTTQIDITLLPTSQDEVVSGQAFDPQTRNQLWVLVRQLNEQEGVTIFLTTHYMDEAERVAQRIAIIDHGAIVAEGSAAALKEQTSTGTLEEAFLALTGTTIREEQGSGLDQMRNMVKMWGGRR